LWYNFDHRGIFFQGYNFLPGVATVVDVVRSSAVCEGGFRKEDGEKRRELGDSVEAVY
jgi:hypothetical protein